MVVRKIQIQAVSLQLALKTTVRHAAFARSEGESIWVWAKRGNLEGFGEGCPRAYVAGDDLATSIAWVQDRFSAGQIAFETLDDLKHWVFAHEKDIDQYPSAWCAVEMALLDLLAREKGQAVEELLGVRGDRRYGCYSAVLGDQENASFATLAELYFVYGLTDFKIKISGDLKRDQFKLDTLDALSDQYHVPHPRIRLDANNLWKDRCDEAVHYTLALGRERFFAVEEPVRAKHVEDICRFYEATGYAVILDESLCALEDLRRFENVRGPFIANIKISRVGGLLRALALIDEVKKQGRPIILGCHVGETSLLTRAALVAAAAAGGSLLAQEGAFGDYLVKDEPVEPVLRFGPGGVLDLRIPYTVNTASGPKIIPLENWQAGFGMQGCMP